MKFRTVNAQDIIDALPELAKEVGVTLTDADLPRFSLIENNGETKTYQFADTPLLRIMRVMERLYSFKGENYTEAIYMRTLLLFRLMGSKKMKDYNHVDGEFRMIDNRVIHAVSEIDFELSNKWPSAKSVIQHIENIG